MFLLSKYGNTNMRQNKTIHHGINILAGYGIVYSAYTCITCNICYWCLPLLIICSVVYYLNNEGIDYV